MGVLVGSGELTFVEVTSTAATVPVGTGLVALQAENKMGRRQIVVMKTRSLRRLIKQIIPANRFPACRMEINDAYPEQAYTFLCHYNDELYILGPGESLDIAI
jgi:hypothetical protein